MIQYRKFKLVNQAGETIDLSEPDNLFWQDVTGLGVEFDHEYISVGAYKKIINTDVVLPDPSGLMRYGKNKNDSYRQFTRLQLFISQAKILYLQYELPAPILFLGERNWVRCEVVLKTTDKSEVKENNKLEETLTFERLSPWSSETLKKVAVSSIVPGDMYEDRNYDPDVIYDDTASTDNLLINLTTDDSYLELFIEGITQDPIIKLRNIKTNEVEVLWKFNGLINDNDKLHHSSYPFDEYILMNDTTNVYQQVEKMTKGSHSVVVIPPGIFKLEYETANAQPGLLTFYHKNSWLVV